MEVGGAEGAVSSVIVHRVDCSRAGAIVFVESVAVSELFGSILPLALPRGRGVSFVLLCPGFKAVGFGRLLFSGCQ